MPVGQFKQKGEFEHFMILSKSNHGSKFEARYHTQVDTTAVLAGRDALTLLWMKPRGSWRALCFWDLLWKSVSEIDFPRQCENGGALGALSVYPALTRLPIFLMV